MAERRAGSAGRRRQGGTRRRPKAGVLASVRGYRPSGVAWAAGGVGLVTFVVTILVLHMLFGGDDERVPQAAAECRSSACADEPPAVPLASEGPAGRDDRSEPSPTRSASASPSASPSRSAASASSTSASPTSASPSATPRATRSRAAAPTPSQPSRTDGRVTIRYSTVNDWRGTFHGAYVVTNGSGSDLPSWRLTFSYPPRKLTALWPYAWWRHGSTIMVSGGALPRGGSTTIYFQGNGEPLVPSSCTFNGSACTPG
ncbi:cellulose binding domain-containing protein [Actinomadura keratinilytica]|uniref:cellulose binding domain-containing protein n=1 Tax=Actinomadura keratinilytica TaxID=547461 RepID=UPI0031E8367E